VGSSGEMMYTSIVPLLLVLVPVAGSFAVYVLGLRFGETLRNLLAIGIALFCFLGAAHLFNLAQQGDVVYRISDLVVFGLNFRVDLLGALFALLSSFIWLLATIFSWTYMDYEHDRDRYYFFLTLTLGGCLGVFLMEDLFGLLIVFELMSLASYLLVIHAQTDEAMSAGTNYLYLGIIGGLAILSGIFLLYTHAGTIAFAPMLEAMDFSAPLRAGIAALLITGFGIKAGMVPLHIWLPKAHPVAPSPASALLSGIMIKTGAYGIIRVVNMLYTPAAEGGPLWLTTQSMGYTIIWFGIATMFMAAFIALFQTNAKRILAYSSISQMGYILMGVGCAAYLGFEGAMGFAGTTFHIMNHAFFKAGMFMLVGAVYVRTHELELSKLGGLYKEFPVTAIAFFVCICGIAGVPGFNGYASKTILHHAIEDAYMHHHWISLYWAERIFTLTSAFTVCYITKLYTSLFFGQRPKELKKMPKEPLVERAIFIIIAASIILMGLFPNVLLDRVIIPAARGFTYDSAGLEYLTKIDLFVAYDLQNIAIAVGLGLLLFVVFSRTGAFNYRPPGWLSVESLVYLPAIKGLSSAFTFLGTQVETGVDTVIVRPVTPLDRFSHQVARWDERLSPAVIEPFLKALGAVYTFAAKLMEAGVEGLLVKSINPLSRVSQQVARWDQKSAPAAIYLLLTLLFRAYTGAGKILDQSAESFWVKSNDPALRVFKGFSTFDQVVLTGLGRHLIQSFLFLRETLYQGWMKAFTATLRAGRRFFRYAFFVFIKVDYDHKDESLYYYINIHNFNFGIILLFAMFVLLMIIGIYTL